MMVAKLTPQQADILRNTQVVPDNYYNPLQDIDGNWIISTQEVDMSNFGWVKTLPLIEFNPIPNPLNILP